VLPPPALPPVRSLGPLGVAAWPAERLDLSLGALAHKSGKCADRHSSLKVNPTAGDNQSTQDNEKHNGGDYRPPIIFGPPWLGPPTTVTKATSAFKCIPSLIRPPAGAVGLFPANKPNRISRKCSVCLTLRPNKKPHGNSLNLMETGTKFCTAEERAAGLCLTHVPRP
jgi:hypothetical protein